MSITISTFCDCSMLLRNTFPKKKEEEEDELSGRSLSLTRPSMKDAEAVVAITADELTNVNIDDVDGNVVVDKGIEDPINAEATALPGVSSDEGGANKFESLR